MKAELKKEADEPQQQEQLKKEPKQPEEHLPDAANECEAMEAEQVSQAKTEDDRCNRKRPYDEGRGYGYYEHREERR